MNRPKRIEFAPPEGGHPLPGPGRKDIPDPTTAGDFCRRFTLGHILQVNRALGEIQAEVYRRRKGILAWTIDVDAKVHEVFGAKKEEAAKSYTGIYSLQPLYAFVHETDELLHSELRRGTTHPGDKAVPFLRRLRRKIPPAVEEIYLRSDSPFYNKEVVDFCEEEGWGFSITADQTAPLRRLIEGLAEAAWKVDAADSSLAYAEVWYQPIDWGRGYRFLVRREKKEDQRGQAVLFSPLPYSYDVVVTNALERVPKKRIRLFLRFINRLYPCFKPILFLFSPLSLD